MLDSKTLVPGIIISLLADSLINIVCFQSCLYVHSLHETFDHDKKTERQVLIQ